MFSFQSRVRYSETDKTGRLSLQAILDYFQDSSTFDGEDSGAEIEYLTKRRRVWLLSAWQIVVERYPKLGEKITIVTFPYDFKSFFGLRNYYMEDENGKKVASANSIWTLINLDTMKPARISEELKEKYVFSEKLTMEYAPRKIEVIEKGEKRLPITIQNHHLDTNNHVNNGQYLQIAMDYLPAELKIKQMRAEYKKSALLGDIVIPFVAKTENTYVVTLAQNDGEIYAIIELKIS